MARRTDAQRTARRRGTADTGGGTAEPARVKAAERQPTRTWRTLVRWAARAALACVVLLSGATVVRVGEPLSSTAREQSAAGATVLLVVAHSRAAYLERCLESVLRAHPGSDGWQVLVSRDRHDGAHAEVDAVVASAAKRASIAGILLDAIAHEPDDNVERGENDELIDEAAYTRIASHYRFALGTAFARGAARVVVLEEDMEVAGDFVSYFNALAPLLERDATLWCVSAWNDNGKRELAVNDTQLLRTDFFPGLGWMLTSKLWQELEPQWPRKFWDDWMRDPATARGRQCVRPEVSRVRNFGEKGVSASFHYREHISRVAMADKAVDFAALDLSYLAPERFDELVFGRMSRAVRLRYSNYLTSRPQDGDVIAFFPRERPAVIGRRTGVMTDHRHGVFRTSYRGVIIIPWRGHWAFLVAMGYEAPEGYTLGNRECCD